MDDKRAATILINFLDKYELDDEEKEAVKAAIGLLSWSCLSKSRMKTLRDRLAKRRLGQE